MPRMKRLMGLSAAVILLLLIFFNTPQTAQAQGDLLARINGLRGSLGLHGYSLNGALSAAAQNHAAWMAATKQISHYQPGGSTPSTRAAAAGYPSSWVSENIYGGTSASADGAWNFWINSPIHYRGLTNANYFDVGIGVASAEGWNFYVLVFGNATGAWGSVPASTSGGGSARSSGPPTFIVGWDNDGNIMHEIQDGHTLGDIALIYGYTWADIPAMLALNEMTDADIRVLPVGGVFLVPPKAGTYTPTPLPEGFATPTPNADEAVQTAIAQAIARETEAVATQRVSVLLTPIFTLTPSATLEPTLDAASQASGGRVATSAAMPIALLGASPSPSPTATPEQVAALFTPAPLTDEILATGGSAPPSGVNPLLVVIIVAQALIIVAAGIAFVRGGRRR
jgi:hypothetical protein